MVDNKGQKTIDKKIEALEKFLKEGSWRKLSDEQVYRLNMIRLAEKQSNNKNFDLTF